MRSSLSRSTRFHGLRFRLTTFDGAIFAEKRQAEAQHPIQVPGPDSGAYAIGVFVLANRELTGEFLHCGAGHLREGGP